MSNGSDLRLIASHWFHHGQFSIIANFRPILRSRTFETYDATYSTVTNVKGDEYGAGQIPSHPGDEVDEGHPLPPDVVLQIAHEHHLEEDRDRQMEEAVKRNIHITFFQA